MTPVLRIFCAIGVLVACSSGNDPVQSDYKSDAICNVASIKGERVGRVPGKIAGCGIKNAVRVYEVSGVSLSQPATLTCDTARALNNWVISSAKPALQNQNGGLSGLKIAAHYVCRTRNHKRGAKISEHGKGRAIDISGFYLKDGTKLSVLNDYYGKGRKSKAMQSMRKNACGLFGTVLGPGSDGYHQDHFHFDTANHRNGPYCR